MGLSDRLNSIKLCFHEKFTYCELNVFNRLHFVLFGPKSVITFKQGKDAMFSDFHSLEIACDAVPHIKMPLNLYFFCVIGKIQTQFQPLPGKRNVINID